MTKPHFILLHGVGQEAEHTPENVLIHLPRAVRECTHVFQWAAMLDEGRPPAMLPHLALLTHALPPPLSLFAEPVAFQVLTKVSESFGDSMGDLLSFDRVKDKAVLALDAYIQTLIDSSVITSHTPLVLIGHSLGSMLSLYYTAWLHDFDADTLPQRKVVKVLTLGSPIDRQPVRRYFERIMRGTLRFPNVVWVNYWGTRDMVCCWLPWRGQLDHWFPTEQVRLLKTGHDLGDYLQKLGEKDLFSLNLAQRSIAGLSRAVRGLLGADT